MNTATITTKKNEEIVNEKQYDFFSFENRECCRLLYQVEKKIDESGYERYYALQRKEDQPVLLRDFPLIGSQNFHFPFYLDGFKFNPLGTRNGLYLNGNLNKEAIDNREIIEKAIKSSIEFTKFLIVQNIDKRYLLAKTNIPEPPERYDDCTINWFIEQQKEWRKNLLDFRLVLDIKGHYCPLKNLKLPLFKNKFNKVFYNLIKSLDMNITGGKLPNEKDIEIWYDIMEKDPLREVYNIKEDTWGFDYLFTEKDLLEKLKNMRILKNLVKLLVKI